MKQSALQLRYEAVDIHTSLSITAYFSRKVLERIFYIFNRPYFVVEWLAFLLCIREVPGSDLGPDTGYPD
jgi:hypothetical protein